MTNEKQEPEHVEAVAVTANALEQIERASIDIQIATAKQYPRSMDLFYKRATAMVTFDAETAASCLYRRPVGKEGNQVKYAEGESIRLAEIVAASFGNIRVAGRITEMEPRYVKAQGVAFDLETNTAYTAEVVESTVTKYGAPFSERMRVVVSKSAQSKAIRDAIFRVIPKSLCKSLVIKAKEVAKGDAKTFEARRKAVVVWIKSLKIDAKRVWDAIGIKGEADIGVEVLLLLHGLKTAIDEGDCTIDEAFPKPQTEQESGSTTERIMNHFTDPDKKVDDTKTEPEKPPRKPRKDKGTKRGKKAEQADRMSQDVENKENEGIAKDMKKEEPKLVKCPICDEEGDPLSHDCSEPGDSAPKEDTPTTVGKDKWKCLRCERHLTDEGLKDGQCPFCFGQVVEIK
jgi:hypothetical protein